MFSICESGRTQGEVAGKGRISNTRNRWYGCDGQPMKLGDVGTWRDAIPGMVELSGELRRAVNGGQLLHVFSWRIPDFPARAPRFQSRASTG